MSLVFLPPETSKRYLTAELNLLKSMHDQLAQKPPATRPNPNPRARSAATVERRGLPARDWELRIHHQTQLHLNLTSGPRAFISDQRRVIL